jgi:hypothetical protein
MLRACIALVLVASGLAQSPQPADKARVYSGTSIPAELKTTIHAEKARRGDPVEFRSLEPVLLGKGVVMPANSKLTGRIVGSAPRQDGKPSWLVLLVERGQWKQQTVPLHAFIAAQMSINRIQPNSNQTTGDATTPPRRAGRISGRAAVENGDASIVPPPQDSREETASHPVYAPTLSKDLRIVRDPDGIVYLFSAESNVTLPNGALLVLQNQDTAPNASSPPEPQTAHLR